MDKRLTEEQVNKIVEETMQELQSQGITDRETVRRVVSQQIEKAKQEEKQSLKFLVQDLVNEMNTEEIALNEADNRTANINPDKIEDLPQIISPGNSTEKKGTKQTAADVAKKYLDEKQAEHNFNNREDREDVKEFWTVRQDRKRIKTVDENKSLKPWQKKFLKIMNKPMRLMDGFVRKCGKSFEPVFCIFIPLIVMLFPIYYIAIGLVNQIATFVTLVFIALFLFFLMFLPKVASAVEFPILAFYVLCKSGALRWAIPSLANWIDPSGWLTYAPGHHPLMQVISGYALALGWGTVFAALIFLLFKVFFFVYLKLKQYRRRYMVRHHHRKKYVAQLDKNSEVLM